MLAGLIPGGVFIGNKIVGLLAAIATIAMIFRMRDALFPDGMSGIGAAIGGFLTATSPVFAYWALGGLETSIQAFLMLSYAAGVIRLHSRRSLETVAWVGVVACFIIAARPEGVWVIPLTVLLLWWSGRASKGYVVLAAGLPLIFFVGLVCIRFSFTGLVFPTPVYAKVGDLGTITPVGARYLFSYWSRGIIGPFHFLALVAALVVVATAWFGESHKRFPLIVVASLTIVGDAFAVLAGGDWMEYFRFLAPVLPLKNLLMAQLIVERRFIRTERRTFRCAPVVVVGALTLAIGVQQQFISGLNLLPPWPTDNCSDTLPADLLRGGFSELPARIMHLNCAHRRDILAIEPFIQQDMRRYLERAGHLTILTYQMGLFPYFVRREFPDGRVGFVDTTGLTDLHVATLPLPKSFFGLVWHNDIIGILKGERGGLSEYVAQRQPNMIYLLGTDAATTAVLARLGFQLVLNRPGAAVFWRGDPGQSSVD